MEQDKAQQLAQGFQKWLKARHKSKPKNKTILKNIFDKYLITPQGHKLYTAMFSEIKFMVEEKFKEYVEQAVNQHGTHG